MNRFTPCSSCARHVKTSDTKCPFCGTARCAQAATRRQRIRRMSRARWLAHGSTLAILGCTGNGASTPPSDQDATATFVRDATSPSAGDTEARSANGDDTALEDGAQAAVGSAKGNDSALGGTTDADAATTPSDSGTATPSDASGCVANLASAGFTLGHGQFLCLQDGGAYANFSSHSDVYCDRATEFCYISGAGPRDDGCHPLSCSQSLTVDAGACDGGTLRCACLSGAYCGGEFNYCDDDDAGGISVSCGSCYGAPPARLSA